jgi:hypothetical protein
LPALKPNCRCYTIPILNTEEEFWDNIDKDEPAESANEVKDVPENFKKWIADNRDRMEAAEKRGTLPYWARDNKTAIDDALKSAAVPEMPAKPPKPVKTEAQKADIQARWDERKAARAQTVSINMPRELKAKSPYLHGEDYTFDNRFFDLIDPANPIKLKVVKGKGLSNYDPNTKTVTLYDGKREADSNWNRKSVVYHEYGHAIDWQRGLRNSKEVADLRAEQIKRLKKQAKRKVWEFNKVNDCYEKTVKKMSLVEHIDVKLKQLNTKIKSMDEKTFTKRGITKDDVVEQILAVRDAVKSLVPKYGDGHETSYFKKPGKKEGECLAHAFENSFIGNEVFKKYMPDVYKEMVEYINALK